MYHEVMIAGILVSLLFTELTGLSAGLIVPGYMALCLSSPGRIVYTLALSLLTFFSCRLLSGAVILYGRRRFAATILLAFAWNAALHAAGIVPAGISAVGIVVPGLLAREFDRQGIFDTLLSLAITTGILGLLIMLGKSLSFGG